MPQIELSSGTIEYTDTGGGGPVIVLLHGLLMDATLWDEVTSALSPGYRCVAPTLPLGAHRRAMKAGADLSLPGIAKLVAEFLDRLGLDDVTLVGNDTGGAVVQLLAADSAARVGRVVLASCDAFDNFPPGLTGRTLALAGKLPSALFGLVMQQMRLRPMRRLPVAFGWLTRRGGDAATARWIKPVLTRPEIRRETARVLRAVFADKRLLLRAAESLPAFDRPALVVWAGRRPRDAARARPAPRRSPAGRPPARDPRQLHPHPPRPARSAGRHHPRVHQRHHYPEEVILHDSQPAAAVWR
jgi:pimeloyl-ACP methyl ester carboxylesterase